MKVRKTIAAVATSLGMVVGFAALAGATPMSTIDTTGPDSINKVQNSAWVDIDVTNHNNLSARNDNHQSAWTGDAKVTGNTRGGSALSGDATNHTSFHASATVNNSGASGALKSVLCGCEALGGSGSSSISNTGPDSYNKISNKTNVNVDVNNTNTIKVTNNNTQTATSGDATVTHNTTGGSATTGNASNTSNTSATFNVTN